MAFANSFFDAPSEIRVLIIKSIETVGSPCFIFATLDWLDWMSFATCTATIQSLSDRYQQPWPDSTKLKSSGIVPDSLNAAFIYDQVDSLFIPIRSGIVDEFLSGDYDYPTRLRISDPKWWKDFTPYFCFFTSYWTLYRHNFSSAPGMVTWFTIRKMILLQFCKPNSTINILEIFALTPGCLMESHGKIPWYLVNGAHKGDIPIAGWFNHGHRPWFSLYRNKLLEYPQCGLKFIWTQLI